MTDTIALFEYEHLAAAHITALAELCELRKQKETWQKVCAFEKKKWEPYYNVGLIDPKSDIAYHIKDINLLAGEE